jgi:hypothetical protein
MEETLLIMKLMMTTTTMIPTTDTIPILTAQILVVVTMTVGTSMGKISTPPSAVLHPDQARLVATQV